jgi:hypothetical protein
MTTTPNNFRDNYVVVIDSLDRDLTKYPDPSEYVISLPETLRNVETIELLSYQMTRTETNVNKNNNRFKIVQTEKLNGVVVGTTNYTITIPEKEYVSTTEFVSTLNSVLPSSYIAEIDALNFLTIKRPVAENANTASFTIEISESSAKLLGIMGSDIRGSGIIDSSTLPLSFTGVSGKSIIDLSGVPYLIVYLNDYERIISSGNKSHKKFLIVPMENHVVGKRFLICGDQKEKKGIYILTNHQKTMYEIRIKICRPDGSLYDFKGIDHIFIFRIYRHDYRDFNS